MATVVGEGIVPVVPLMSGFQAQVAGEIKKSSAGLASAAAGAGKLLGFTLGAALAVGIGKSSFKAFDAVQKQQNLLQVGLQRIGQGSTLSGLLGGLKQVSDKTFLARDATDALGAGVLNLGHDYFASLGPAAAVMLPKIVLGLDNIAAAGGNLARRTLPALERTLFTTPAKAIPLLQKLGVITSDDAARYTEMAKAGNTLALRQELVNKVIGAYTGAAARSATANEKLAHTWNNIEIGIGAVVSKGADVLLWMTGSTTAAKDLRLAILGVGAAWLSWRVLAFIPPLLDRVVAGVAALSSANAVRAGTQLALFSTEVGALGAASILTTAALYPLGLAAAFWLVNWGKAIPVITSGNKGLINQAIAARGSGLALKILNDAATKAAGAGHALAGGVSAADAAAGLLAAQEQTAAEQTNKLADSLVKLQLQLTQLAGGFLGVKGAALGVRAANLSYDQAVAQLNKDVKANTDANTKNNVSTLQLRQDHLAVQQAMIGRVQAQVSLTDSIQKFADQELASGRATAEVIKEVRGFAHQAGLTKEQTQGLIDTVLQLGIKYGQLPKSVATNVYAPGLDSVRAKAEAFNNLLSNMNGRQVAIYFKAHGLVPAQHGFHGWVDEPTLLLTGEGHRRERVDVTPGGGGGAAPAGTPGGGGPLVNIGTMVAADPEAAAAAIERRFRRARLLRSG